MSSTSSRGGRIMPSSQLRALLAALQSVPFQQGAGAEPSPPPFERAGLIGSGYRAFMRRTAGGAPVQAGALRAASLPQYQAAQFAGAAGASGAAIAGMPPPLPPNLHLPPLEPVPPLPPPGFEVGALPPPLGALVMGGRLAGVLGGQRSELKRPPPPPPASGNGDPYEWSSRAECTAQYNQDLAVCRSDFKPPRCFGQANERLAQCNKGRLDFPPLWGWPRRK